MPSQVNSPLGVCILPAPASNYARTVAYPHYIHEILRHAGLCYEAIAPEEIPDRLPDLKLLLTVGEGDLPTDTQCRLRSWIEGGGGWVSVGGTCGMGEALGTEAEPPAYSSWGGGTGVLGEGYLSASEGQTAHPVLQGFRIPLHFFNGVPVREKGGTALAGLRDAHGRPTPRAGIIESACGRGRCLLIAPDVTGTVVRIRQGSAVTRDGVPAPDGTAPLCDDVLKSDDGGVLDWILDRQPVPGVPGLSAFLEPIADAWCDLLIRALLYMAHRTGAALPLLWYYPRGLPALGHISHDTDGNEPEKARRLLQTLQAHSARSTWCTILPGYSPEIIGGIRAAGHELAFHYDAMSEGKVWGESGFDEQWRAIVELFGGERPVTNKNHYLRWEGDTDLFEWCQRRGIGLDQSKGASKTGEAGFNFGSCHPYFPVSPDGRTIDVLELPTPTQDLNVFAPDALLAPLLDAVVRHHGVLHLLFHPAHIDKPDVEAALADAIRRGREAGLEWWTAREINAWERARRAVQWSGYENTSEGRRFTLHAERPLEGATVLCLCPAGQALSSEGRVASHNVTRWGFTFQSLIFDLEPGRPLALDIDS